MSGINKQAMEFYESVHLRIEEFCRPLNDYLGIPFFMYYKIYKEGKSYTLLTNNMEVTREYYLKINNDKFYYQSYLESDSKSKNFLIWPCKPTSLGMQIYFDRGFWNGITIMKEIMIVLKIIVFSHIRIIIRSMSFLVGTIKY